MKSDGLTLPGGVVVLYEDESLLVCVKPAGLPTAPVGALAPGAAPLFGEPLQRESAPVSGAGTPLPGATPQRGSAPVLGAPLAPFSPPATLLEAAARHAPEVLAVRGKKPVEGGLVHRIDTATTGLVLLTKTQNAYDFMQSEQAAGRFVKEYRALCSPGDPLPGAPRSVCAQLERVLRSGGSRPDVSRERVLPLAITSTFRPYGERGRGVKPVFPSSGMADRKKAGSREYETVLLSLAPAAPFSKSERETVSCGTAGMAPGDASRHPLGENTVPLYQVTARIAAGYRHQVRSHLAAVGLFVFGDPLYPALWGCGARGTEPVEVSPHLAEAGQCLSPVGEPRMLACHEPPARSVEGVSYSSAAPHPAGNTAPRMQFFASALSFTNPQSGEPVRFELPERYFS